MRADRGELRWRDGRRRRAPTTWDTSGGERLRWRDPCDESRRSAHASRVRLAARVPHRDSPAPAGPEPAPTSSGPALAGPEPGRGGLQRRVPGAQLVETATSPPTSNSPAAPSRHDAAAARETFDGYQSAIAQATGIGATAPVPVGSSTSDRAGLSRRVPGANLAPALRSAVGSTGAGSSASRAQLRDPDAELAAFDAFSAGLARADRAAGSTDSASPRVPTPIGPAPVPQPRARPSDLHNAEPTNGSNA